MAGRGESKRERERQREGETQETVEEQTKGRVMEEVRDFIFGRGGGRITSLRYSQGSPARPSYKSNSVMTTL